MEKPVIYEFYFYRHLVEQKARQNFLKWTPKHVQLVGSKK
jgi:hypothetical protein